MACAEPRGRYLTFKNCSNVAEVVITLLNSPAMCEADRGADPRGDISPDNLTTSPQQFDNYITLKFLCWF